MRLFAWLPSFVVFIKSCKVCCCWCISHGVFLFSAQYLAQKVGNEIFQRYWKEILGLSKLLASLSVKISFLFPHFHVSNLYKLTQNPTRILPTSCCLFLKQQDIIWQKRCIAKPGFDPGTSGLWARLFQYISKCNLDQSEGQKLTALPLRHSACYGYKLLDVKDIGRGVVGTRSECVIFWDWKGRKGRKRWWWKVVAGFISDR